MNNHTKKIIAAVKAECGVVAIVGPSQRPTRGGIVVTPRKFLLVKSPRSEALYCLKTTPIGDMWDQLSEHIYLYNNLPCVNHTALVDSIAFPVKDFPSFDEMVVEFQQRLEERMEGTGLKYYTYEVISFDPTTYH